MKLWRVNSPFYIFVGVLFLFYSTYGFCQEKEKTVDIKQKLDSISYYYKLSKKDSLLLSERLHYVSSFINGATIFQKDSLIYNGLMQKTWLLSKSKMYDSAINYSQKLYTYSKINKDTTYILKAFKKLGYYHYMNNQLNQAFKFHNEAFKISRLTNDSINAGKSLLQMANIQNFLGDYSGSKTTATDGLKYIENTLNLRTLSGLYHCISVANLEQKNYDEALKYNTRALKVGKQGFEDKQVGIKSILIFKTTKANILADQKKYNEAISLLEVLLLDAKIKEDKVEYSRIIANLGYIQWLQDATNSKSELLLLDAKNIRKEIKDVQGLYASNNYLTKFYLQKDREKAFYYAEAAYQNARTRQNLTSIIESLGFIFQLKENTNEEAKVYDRVHKELQEINQSNREIYAVTKYENDKLTNENLVLKAETAKKQRQILIYLFGTILIALSAGFILYLLQQRHKREKIRDVFNAETRISKKIHDELANDVYNVMVQIQNDQDAIAVLDRLENIYSRTRDISRENSSFDTGENFAQELGGMLSSFSSDTTKIIIKDIEDVPWESVKPEKKIVVHRIVQELMVNMKKHSEAGLVAVTFKKLGKNIEISYADNGVGACKNEIIFSSGLQNAENRIKPIGGSFIFDTEKGKGFKAKLNFPS